MWTFMCFMHTKALHVSTLMGVTKRVQFIFVYQYGCPHTCSCWRVFSMIPIVFTLTGFNTYVHLATYRASIRTFSCM